MKRSERKKWDYIIGKLHDPEGYTHKVVKLEDTLAYDHVPYALEDKSAEDKQKILDELLDTMRQA